MPGTDNVLTVYALLEIEKKVIVETRIEDEPRESRLGEEGRSYVKSFRGILNIYDCPG